MYAYLYPALSPMVTGCSSSIGDFVTKKTGQVWPVFGDKWVQQLGRICRRAVTKLSEGLLGQAGLGGGQFCQHGRRDVKRQFDQAASVLEGN